jgi:hypothetical protein
MLANGASKPHCKTDGEDLPEVPITSLPETRVLSVISFITQLIPYQRDVWAEFCPIFKFIHFRDLNIEPFEKLGKMLILGSLFYFAPINRQVLDFMNLQPFDRLGRFLSLISKVWAVNQIT